MAELLLPGDILSMTARAADRLMGAGNGDAALLYLWLLRRGGRLEPEAARRALKWDVPRYRLLSDYEQNPDKYPDGPTDEFHGRYSADYIRNLRNNFRRNRDLCIIISAGLYVLQIVDVHAPRPGL